MLNQPPSATGQAGRYLLLAPLLALTLGLGTACSDAAQSAPEPVHHVDSTAKSASVTVRHTGPEPVYYIDGQRTSKAAADQLAPQLTSSIEIMKGENARRIFNGDEAVIVITTKAGENSAAVRELNVKMDRMLKAPTVIVQTVAHDSRGLNRQTPPTPVPVPIPTATMAYLTKNYPNYRLIQTAQILSEAGKVDYFNLEISVGQQTKHVIFDEQGQFVREK